MTHECLKLKHSITGIGGGFYKAVAKFAPALFFIKKPRKVTFAVLLNFLNKKLLLFEGKRKLLHVYVRNFSKNRQRAAPGRPITV